MDKLFINYSKHPDSTASYNVRDINLAKILNLVIVGIVCLVTENRGNKYLKIRDLLSIAQGSAVSHLHKSSVFYLLVFTICLWGEQADRKH
jgi:hypothetical protein